MAMDLHAEVECSDFDSWHITFCLRNPNSAAESGSYQDCHCQCMKEKLRQARCPGDLSISCLLACASIRSRLERCDHNLPCLSLLRLCAASFEQRSSTMTAILPTAWNNAARPTRHEQSSNQLRLPLQYGCPGKVTTGAHPRTSRSCHDSTTPSNSAIQPELLF